MHRRGYSSFYRDGPAGRHLERLQTVIFQMENVWLFTASDLKTIVGPSLLFGIANALAGTGYGIKQPVPRTARETICQAPWALFWVWMNLLPFTINNQRSPDAIKEDAVNKPWRTLPSQRMSPQQAERLMFTLYPSALLLSLWIGGARQSAALIVLGTWYNNFGGGDASCCVRNLINALGYVCFTSGAMEVSLGIALPVQKTMLQWFGIIAGIILSTVHLQDMYDQAGDRLRGRSTVPLTLGDKPTRYLTTVAMLFWGLICPMFWTSDLQERAVVLTVAITVAYRTLLYTTTDSDRLTFKLWNVWMALIFLLPLSAQKWKNAVSSEYAILETESSYLVA
ncbi:MAG: hypothetical protein M1820_007329 [Bogoriella megaspora]|nr:MAG: hypothetical protein M1820_007329 [Bogoriella megaspora]